MNSILNLTYIMSSILFIHGLKLMSSPVTARRGNLFSGIGMLLAVIITLLDTRIMQWAGIFSGLLVGVIIGILVARTVAMTQMPEMVALLNGFGGLASLLLGWSVYHSSIDTSLFLLITVYLSILIGGVTFTGSVIAFGKLNGKWMSSKPVFLPFHNVQYGIVAFMTIVLGVVFVSFQSFNPYWIFFGILTGAFILGVLSVIPVGGADMPVIISLLNSYSGLAACFAGFVIENNLLIVAGALVGASGIILTAIMCKAMNRSLRNILFSGFGANMVSTGKENRGEVKPATPEEAYYLMEAAHSVVVIPGYGLAVAQAQHAIKELADILVKRGTEVKYGIHPVAGRMPGHMNVLLAEANVPYEQLLEMEEVNTQIKHNDLCVIIGANDVVNTSALEDPQSPIYGMPIINAHEARTVLVIKRSMSPGFSGADNPLFYKDNTRMVFGDAKTVLQQIIKEFSSKV